MVVFLLVTLLSSLLMLVKLRFQVKKYFLDWNSLLFGQFMGGVMTFVLFWTLAYDIVHVF